MMTSMHTYVLEPVYLSRFRLILPSQLLASIDFFVAAVDNALLLLTFFKHLYSCSPFFDETQAHGALWYLYSSPFFNETHATLHYGTYTAVISLIKQHMHTVHHEKLSWVHWTVKAFMDNGHWIHRYFPVSGLLVNVSMTAPAWRVRIMARKLSRWRQHIQLQLCTLL